jgi:tetratricopeptide (TPR) repeat protein
VQDAEHAPLPQRTAVWRLRWPFAAAIAVLAVLAIGLIALKFIGRASSVPVVAIAAADASPASESLARDLLVKLASLPTGRPESIELISDDQTTKTPTLVFQVSRSEPREGTEANLTLINASNRSLLWSKDFRDPSGNYANLRQQLAHAAAYALRCALRGLDPQAGRLSQEALKTYVTACATWPDASMVDVVQSIPRLRKLAREFPKFRGGWAMLLLSETYVVMFGSEGETMRPLVRRDVVEARKHHRHLPEAYIAEGVLITGPDILNRARLLDEGVKRNPDSAELLFMRHNFLAGVGRTEEALSDARRAMELDPLSPEIRWGYITSLGLAGRTDEALAALNEADRLWPGSPAVRAARLTLHLRAGDPREAQKLLRAGAAQEAPTSWLRVQEALLQARIDRSPQNIERAIQAAATRYSQGQETIGTYASILAEFGREEELFPILLNWRRTDLVPNVAEVLFRPVFADFHKDPRFMKVAMRLGLLDYWRVSGKWPDLCARPDLAYDCKEEAAKLAA